MLGGVGNTRRVVNILLYVNIILNFDEGFLDRITVLDCLYKCQSRFHTIWLTFCGPHLDGDVPLGPPVQYPSSKVASWGMTRECLGCIRVSFKRCLVLYSIQNITPCLQSKIYSNNLLLEMASSLQVEQVVGEWGTAGAEGNGMCTHLSIVVISGMGIVENFHFLRYRF